MFSAALCRRQAAINSDGSRRRFDILRAEPWRYTAGRSSSSRNTTCLQSFMKLLDRILVDRKTGTAQDRA
jgi:hypothetical protein